MATYNIDESAHIVNIKKTRGDTWKWTVTMKQGGVPIPDLTGWEFNMQVRHPRTGELITGLDLSLGDGIELTGNPGEIEGIVPTDELECNAYPYDLQFLRPDGYKRTPFGGKITTVPDTTTP